MKNRFILFFFASTQIFAQNSFLESYISQPIQSSLTVSEDGNQLAWVINNKGKRNIYHKNESGNVKAITAYDKDDGQEISSLLFTEDGNRLIYVRGSSANRAGENPNPMNLTSGAEQAIWIISLLDNNEHYKLANGNNPMLWKAENKLLYTSKGQIYEVGLDENRSSNQLFQARGSNGSVSISPDGNLIAFSSSRGDHAYIGVFSKVEETIKWIAPQTDRDNLPVWSPDGKQLAFIRTPGLKFGELNNLTGGVEFSVVVADVNTGNPKTIWTSPADDGGFAQYYPSTPLKWTKTNRILFTSEHQGWLHIYSLNPDGSDLKDITPGYCETENYTLDADEKNIYYDCNCDDIDRRHIWKSGVSETKSTQITFGEGIEMFPSIANNELYCFQSTYDKTKTLVHYNQQTKKFKPFVFSTISGADFIMPEQIILTAEDGTKVHAQLFIDRNKKIKRPGIVFMHGGPIRQMLLGFHYSDYYINTYAFNQFMAKQGYAVISVNFRSGTGYGRAYRRAENQGPRGASEYQDVVAAAKYLQSLSEVNVDKIGLWGGSYGGYLTAMGLARSPEIFKAGVDLHGVHDWKQRAILFSPGGGWGLTESDYEIAYASSPVADLSKWKGPVLMVHGDDDRNVLFQQTTDLVERLRERKVNVEILSLPDEVHGFLRYDSWRRVFESSKDFFDRHLKN